MKAVIIDLAIILLPTILGITAGQLKERLNSKYKINEERYIKFYWEFEHIYLLKTKGAFLFSQLDEVLQEEFLNILLSGYCYADNTLKQKIIEFRWQFNCKDTEALNNNFNDITRIIFNTGNKLTRKLYGRSFKLNIKTNLK